MLPFGNANTLSYHANEARKSQWFKRNKAYAKELPQSTVVAETQLLRGQHWPNLTVQLFEEPALVTPILLAPPRQLRLVLLLSGAMRIGLHSGGRDFTYHSAPGTVKLTSSQHLPYEMQWVPLTAEPVRSAHVYLPNNLLVQTAEAAGLNPARVELAEGVSIEDPLLYQLGRALAQEVESPQAQVSLYAETATQMLAAQLLMRHCTVSHELPTYRGKLPAERLRQLRDYVQAHLSRAITLEELAALVYLSPYHFIRVFKRTTGLSPNQFVIRQRMERAVELLQHSDLNVSQVAAAVGYVSHPHFTKLFARCTGRLPTAYRKERLS
ncbi:helix-turn-helix domain-containing protein [uncultured Hymenobacter sp.]|uniref:AraC family transcriptional regulator n=1 Tax=uncultured Hymenobacter sp. TaxID=170016 RepID=UPI0035CBD320